MNKIVQYINKRIENLENEIKNMVPLDNQAKLERYWSYNQGIAELQNVLEEINKDSIT